MPKSGEIKKDIRLYIFTYLNSTKLGPKVVDLSHFADVLTSHHLYMMLNSFSCNYKGKHLTVFKWQTMELI